MRRPLALLLTALLLLVPACGDDDDSEGTTGTTGSSSTSSSSTSTTTSGDDPSTEQPIGETGTDVQEDDGGQGFLTDVRLARHDGFDRIVFEFEGDAPGYRVEYVEPPITEDASGEEVDVEGNAFLQVRMEPASGFDTTGEGRQTYTGPRRIDGAGGPVQELVRTGDFEAVLHWVAGVDEERPFAVDTLDSPPRVVVDIES